MGDNTEYKGQLTVDSLSQKAIRKELLSDAIQHPATLLPLAVGVLSIVYLEFFSPIFGGSLWALIALICAGAVAAGAFFWRYVVRYRETYARRMQEARELQEQVQKEREQAALKKLREKVGKGFLAINSEEGLKAVKDLAYEYEQLQLVLQHKKGTEYLFVADIQELAEKTFRQGLSVLVNAVELGHVIHSTDRKGLEAEIQKFEQEMNLLENDGNSAAQVNIKQATVNSHKERLEMIKHQQVQVDTLLYQCDRCEASLQRTRLDLASLKTESSETSISAVTDTLRQTIDQAKEVQEELKKLGF